jgi:ArsR family transcriptional regulator
MTATSAPSTTQTTSSEECCVATPVETLVPPPDDETLAAMAKAVAHPARLAILRLLTHRETCVTGDVVAELPLAQSTVSEHLRILREAGLIQGEIEGPRTRYCVNATGLAVLKSGIDAL